METQANKSWVVRQFVFSDILAELDEQFAEIGVSYMPIKGAYLIAAGLAEKMRRRRIDDIDLLVNEGDLEKATSHFFALDRTIPRTDYKDNYRPYETQFFRGYKDIYVAVEIHSLLNFPQRFRLPTSALFGRARRQEGETSYLPCAEDALLIHICHLFTHFFMEFRDTNYEEIAQISAQEGFCWERFWELARETGVDAFIYLVLTLYGDATGVELAFPRRHRYADMQASIIRRFGYENLPQWYKRVFLELPFVRDPWWLVRKKVRGNR